VTATDTHRAIDAVWRIESPKLIAGLARIVRDVGVAEDLAQDALVAALEQWPQSGVPDNPGAWLMAAAKHRAIDHFRRNTLLDRKHEELGRENVIQKIGAREVRAGEDQMKDLEAAFDDDVGDDLLRLMFVACHPVLSTEARVALTLRLLGGLTTDEIARAFLVPEPTIAQRIVRAKRTLAEARVPFEVPRGDELAARLSSVLAVIYLVFNEGYSATAGDDWMRPSLCEEALRLGRVLAELAPQEPEVHGLIALMEIQASRSRARIGPSGEPILLNDQNRAKLGSTPNPTWPRSARARRKVTSREAGRQNSPRRQAQRRKSRRRSAPRRSGSVRAASRDRRLSCTSAYSGRNGLAAHRHALRFTRPTRAIPCCGIESCSRCGHGVRSCRGPQAGRCTDLSAVTRELSPVAERARRFPVQAQPLRRSPR
jgi:RNA polymerase sigma factor (sigma-70 family)